MVTPIVSGSYHISDVLRMPTWILRILVFRDVMLPRGAGARDFSKDCGIFIFKDELVHFAYGKFIGIIVITSNITSLNIL
jgi:hypothetical protein